MKKVFLSILVTIAFMGTVFATDFPNLKYKNINLKSKISYDYQTGAWSKGADKKLGNYYTKTKGFGDYYDYLDSNKNFAFSTNCEYEFIYNNKLIGYSNRDMKFYEFSLNNGILEKRIIPKEEVIGMFPEYKVISFADFSLKTNSLKIKKHIGDLKIIILNETDKTYDNYAFSSGNAKFEQYDLRGFLNISKPGMIEFSNIGEQDRKNWYILLIR